MLLTHSGLDCADLRRAALVVCVSENRPTHIQVPEGGAHFWNRQAYDLGYACQRDDRFRRLQRRAAKLIGQLGDGSEGWDTPPSKPKWMRWRTYERKYELWKRVVEKANDEFVTRARRLKLT